MTNDLSEFIHKCHRNIVSSGDNELAVAKAYLDGRQVSDETIGNSKIGYCYNDQPIPNGVKFFGKDPEEIDTWGYSSTIKRRIIVPVFDEFGDAAGFATHEPSNNDGTFWWNLPKPFFKGNHLFFLNNTRKFIYDLNKVYLVEGYVDTILLYQHGIYNVAGLMGTALTQRKISLIMRYCDNVCLCMDTDENNSGQKARDKAIATLNEFDFCDNISVIDLPMEEDPASFLANNSAQDLLDLEDVLTSAKIKDAKDRLRKTK